MPAFSRADYESLIYSLLASSFPHHRHEPPDLKDNRRPAPGISFQSPNLPTLIADCIELGQSLKKDE